MVLQEADPGPRGSCGKSAAHSMLAAPWVVAAAQIIRPSAVKR